jgi:hypothetical protein
VDEVKPAACLPTVEHREPRESRGSCTDLRAPGGEIPPGDSSDRYQNGGPRRTLKRATSDFLHRRKTASPFAVSDEPPYLPKRCLSWRKK